MEIRSYQGTSFSLIPLDAEGEENNEFPALFVFGDLLSPNDLERLAAVIEKETYSCKSFRIKYESPLYIG